jgi:hypothetical protein
LRNISWWVGFFFTTGSIVWVFNGVYAFFPYVNTTSDTFASQLTITAILGGSLFEAGAILMTIEALSTDERVELEYILNPFADRPLEENEKRRRRTNLRLELKRQLRDVGFIASIITLFSATVYLMSCITSDSSVIGHNPSNKLVTWAYWFPQIVGGAGFIVSSVLLTLETQRTWWRIEPFSLGWNVGFWNLVGAIGFTLCGIFGIPSQSHANSWTGYQSSCSTLWGSCAFLIGKRRVFI